MNQFFVKYNNHCAAVSAQVDSLKKIKNFSHAKGVLNFFACDEYGNGDFEHSKFLSEWFSQLYGCSEKTLPLHAVSEILKLCPKNAEDQIIISKETELEYLLSVEFRSKANLPASVRVDLNKGWDVLPAVTINVWRQILSVFAPKLIELNSISAYLSNDGLFFLTDGSAKTVCVVPKQ